MGVNACQHIAVRVGDIERSARFYLDVFDGRYLTLPFEVDGPQMEGLFGGHAGLRVKVCLLGFDQGVVELFQFLEPLAPTGPEDPTRSMIMHWGFQVDDVAASLARVESLGGRTVQPMMDWGGANFVYCYDLDGNVFEIMETSVDDTVRRTLDMFPDAAPPAS